MNLKFARLGAVYLGLNEEEYNFSSSCISRKWLSKTTDFLNQSSKVCGGVSNSMGFFQSSSFKAHLNIPITILAAPDVVGSMPYPPKTLEVVLIYSKMPISDIFTLELVVSGDLIGLVNNVVRLPVHGGPVVHRVDHCIDLIQICRI